MGLAWTGVDDPSSPHDAADRDAACSTPSSRRRTWDAMDARLWTLMVGLPLYSPSVFVGWSPSIAGVLVSDTLAGFVAQVPVAASDVARSESRRPCANLLRRVGVAE